MKPIVLASTLCVGIIACTFDKDTAPPKMWARTVLPRLSNVEWRPCAPKLQPDHVVAKGQCGAAEEILGACPDPIATKGDASYIIRRQPACIDDAIVWLTAQARLDAGLKSELAAAYYVRAQHDDQPADLLMACKTGREAVQAAPLLAEARFNLALAEEAIGLADDAIASWKVYLALDKTSGWSIDARQHLKDLQSKPDAATALTKLKDALRARDRKAVARLVASFPYSAERHFEDEVLPNASVTLTEEASLLAEELTRLSGDRFPTDAIAAISQATPEQRMTMKEGFAAYREARRLYHEHIYDGSLPLYQRAARLLDESGHPQHLVATSYAAILGDSGGAAALQDIGNVARSRHYLQLQARTSWMHGYSVEGPGRYRDAIQDYETAIKLYTDLHDIEGATIARRRKIGGLRLAGQTFQSTREAIIGMREYAKIVEPQESNGLAGEATVTALALDHPQMAVAYGDLNVRHLRKVLDATQEQSEITRLNDNLAMALRERARAELALNEVARAQNDLQHSEQLQQNAIDTNVRRLMQARYLEVEGARLAVLAPNQAVTALTEAIGLASVDDFPTFRASLLTQRAVLRPHSKEAERDLLAALGLLEIEEGGMLSSRQRGEGEAFWSPYFERFRETYEGLAQYYIDRREIDKAFRTAEKMRSREPLDLLMRLTVTPPEFRDLFRRDDLGEMRSRLPAGTTLLEYLVLENRTYAWIVARDQFELVELKAGHKTIKEWTAALHRAAQRRRADVLRRNLHPPYDALLAPVLKQVKNASRLVIVPDRAMHGLPFSALLDSTNHHLIEKHVVSVDGSLRLYLFSLIRDARIPPDDSILLIGNPQPTDAAVSQRLRPLPGAQHEVETIRDMYKHVVLRDKERATVAEFLFHAPKSAIVHVAAHAIVNAQMPSQSMIVLAPSATDSGALTAEKLIQSVKQLDRTRLVVLSTCSSAGGLPVGPEGVAPLVRPLITAGVPAVIGSLWDVDDAPTETLLVSFHRHYRQEGVDAAVALQRAQLEILNRKDLGTQSVLEWSPFEVIGHASSPFAPARP